MCNSEIKFAAFADYCIDTGADIMATGHYARIRRDEKGAHLLKGVDASKDQSYFLCMLTEKQLSRAMFPIGEIEKSEVREIAEKSGLAVAKKKDSTGICFIGERKFKQFLANYLPAQPGEMRTLSGEFIAPHDGLMYYTLGQRRGLDIGGRGTGQRWFVVAKDMEKNILYVEQGEDSPALYTNSLSTEPFSFIHEVSEHSFECTAKFRYRQPDRPVFVTKRSDGGLDIEFKEKERAITPGQYAVLYNGDECLGGGVIL